MRRLITLFAAGLLACNYVSGQEVAVKPGNHFNAATGISNEGVVCGYPDFRDPYQLWYPATDKVELIGGLGPGYGVGGNGVFSTDGKYLCGSSEKATPVSQEWQRKVFKQSYTFKEIVAKPAAWFMVGSFPEGDGVVLASTAWNRAWRETFASQSSVPVKKMVSISSVGLYDLFIAGESTLARTLPGILGGVWTPMTPVADNVASYLSIDFSTTLAGVVGALLSGGKYAVYSTFDAGNSWLETTGFSGTPVGITHTGITHYMVTKEGKIWQLNNDGKAWTELATVSNEPRRIKFYDENIGAVAANGSVYVTTDKGITWKPIEVAEGVTSQTVWNDVAWVDKDNMVLVGTKDVIYTSKDGGATWTWINKELSDGKTELFSVTVDEHYIQVCGDHSVLYKKFQMESIDYVEASKYDVEKKEWTQLGNLGGCDVEVLSGGFNISGDGKTVVGNSYIDFDENEVYTRDDFRIPCHGIVWSEAEGLTDLGCLFDRGDTRGNAVSDDGSVIVGYETWKTGEWLSAVWRKNPQGGYFPNDYILIDPEGPVEFSNIVKYCSAVSANGKWIGGINNDYTSSWIWSEETGVIFTELYGLILYVSDDGDLAFTATGVWTKKDGAMSLANYMESLDIDVDAYEDDGIGVSSLFIQSVSRNGRFVAGSTLVDGIPATVRIDFKYNESGIWDNTASGRISVSQNLVADCLTVELPAGDAQLNLFDMQGRQIKAQSCVTGRAEIQVSNVPEGLYILNIAIGKTSETFKVQIRR